jgi:hypothetical protein
MKPYEDFCKDLDQLGSAAVRERLETNVFVGGESNMARAWLARKSEVASAEQLALAREAASEARLANTTAKTAKRIAVASMIVTIIGIAVGVIMPHYWH